MNKEHAQEIMDLIKTATKTGRERAITENINENEIVDKILEYSVEYLIEQGVGKDRHEIRTKVKEARSILK
jgi:hypothetical protein